MKHLYAPWRGAYINRTSDSAACIFCDAHRTSTPEDSFVIERTDLSSVLLNIYPYNPGHLLISTARHVAEIQDLTQKERADIMERAAQASNILRTEFGADGINIGVNGGSAAAGGSIPDHFHLHVVPRWFGDTNFLPVIAHTKHLSADLMQVYSALSAAWKHTQTQ